MRRLLPVDVYNCVTQANVAPLNHVNPEPVKNGYDLAVIGAGTAGLVAAAGAAALGAKTCLVENHLMGGDCLNYGCVPSKSIIEISRIAFAAGTQAEKTGVNIPAGTTIDFGRVMENMREKRAKISINDSVGRFMSMGVDVFFGAAVFTGRNCLEAAGKLITFRKAIIATGARPAHPEIPGIRETGYLTNETVFNITEKPETMIIIGGGPVGCELAQAFSRLGIKICILQNKPRLLEREDEDASALLLEQFTSEGIEVVLGARTIKVEKKGGKKAVHYEAGGIEKFAEADEILAGAGRVPNVEGMGLDAAGVKYDVKSGVLVDDRLRTTNKKIFAAGDICSRFKFTHSADFYARAALQNALFGGRKKVSKLNIPWCTYTYPEIAHTGIYEKEAEAKGIKTGTFKVGLSDIDRAVTEGREKGFVKFLVKKDTDKILGATIAAGNAGDLISEVSTAMAGCIGLSELASVIHPYPTDAEAIRKAGDMYNRTRLTPFAKRILHFAIKIFGR
jgi:pyruvate/2-oxoglutarate dehydrogenase complex dihydrolipoamide dehydrogenase (E3) component